MNPKLVMGFAIALLSIGTYFPVATASSSFWQADTLICSGLPSLWSATALFQESFKGGGGGTASMTDKIHCTFNGTFSTSIVGFSNLLLTSAKVTVTIFDQNGGLVVTGSTGSLHNNATFTVQTSAGASATAFITTFKR